MPTRERRAKQLGISVDELPDGRGKNPKPKGKDHYRWNDGRMLSEHGYVKIRVGVEHPLADPNGYAYEHLLVWCAANREPPGPGQILHHRSGDRTDNRLRNLELMARGRHNAIHNAERGRDSRGRFLPRGILPGQHPDDVRDILGDGDQHPDDYEVPL